MTTQEMQIAGDERRNAMGRATARSPAYYGRDTRPADPQESVRHREAFDALMNAVRHGGRKY